MRTKVVNSLGLVVAFRCIYRIVWDSRHLVVPRCGFCEILDSGIIVVNGIHIVGGRCLAGAEASLSQDSGAMGESERDNQYTN